MFEFKPFCCAVVPFVLACGVAKAQDKQPVAPLVAPTQTASKPAEPVRLSAGQINLGDGLIVPGQRIGPLALGASSEEVEKIIGPPVDTVQMCDGFAYSVWRWTAQPVEKSRLDVVLLIFEKQRVVQIETNSPAFVLPNGLSVQSSVAEWNKFWHEESVRQIVMNSIIGSPFHITWKRRGFALEVPWPGRTQSVSPIQRVIVLPEHQLAKTTFGIWSFSRSVSAK